ncbi:MAG: hypothetical protein HYU41_19875 [Candidatus Rokubacteria bacterium]|nr:hypothetical protein [Candidatus Rokubacteria bacterium]
MRLHDERTSRIVELLRRCREHEEAAWSDFHVWFRQIAARVLDGFRNLTPVEREEAEDTARVTMALGITDGRVRAEGDGAAVTYARVVITNAARDIWRRRRPTEPLPAGLEDAAPTAAQRAALLDELGRIERAVGAWNAEDRFIFVMKLHGGSTAAIRADLERLYGTYVSAEAIDVRFHRLRRQLRHRIERPE